MSFRLSQVPVQKQDLRLNPQLLHSLRLLSLPREQLEEYVEQEALANPFLSVARNEAAQAYAFSRGGEPLVRRARIVPRTLSNEGDDQRIDQSSLRETLRSHLLHQLAEMDYEDDSQRVMVEWLIDSLDERGYLADPLSELAESFEVDADDLEEALLTLQDQATPAGVGARTPDECLEIQARRFRDEDDAHDIETTKKLVDFVRHHLTITKDGSVELTSSPADIAHRLAIPEAHVEVMSKLVRTFDLKPGLGFADDAQIIPDFRVIEDENGIFDVAPINAIEIETAPPQPERGALDRKTRDQLNHARSIKAAWERRRQTELSVARSVVHAQQRFFREGAQGMQALTQRDVAEDIGMHESTVSRVVAGRYLLTPNNGSVELRQFFSRALPKRSGGSASSFTVKVLIREMVEKNPKEVRLSDSAIAERLQSEHGIQIARRTVAKYRKSLDLESSTRRNKTS